MPKGKSQIVTFKAEASLLKALRGVSNRSEFIRNAILAALESTCPLCSGTGILTPTQREHWEAFAVDHSIEECSKCHALRLVCENSPAKRSGRRKRTPEAK